MMTTVLADCPTCKVQREVKILDCDACLEAYLEAGGDEAKYSELECAHLQCLTCDERLD